MLTKASFEGPVMRYIQHKRHLPPDTIKMFLTKQLSKKDSSHLLKLLKIFLPTKMRKILLGFFFKNNWVFEYFPSEVMLKQTIFEFDQTGK